MRVEIDDKSGFCFGVVRAITEAERALGEGGTVYSLGDIVHNRIEVQRLEQPDALRGLRKEIDLTRCLLYTSDAADEL